MVGFFPTPYPDECLYSILCRYYAHNGISGYETCSRELFGNVQSLTLSVFWPMKLERVDEWFPARSGITRRDIVANHTSYSYWAMTYPPDFRSDMADVIDGGVPVIETNNAGSLKSRRSWAEYLKYCPLCVAEDNAVFGETYWRRQHQLSEIFYCTKHKVRLVNSYVQMKQTGTGFYPASSETIDGSGIDLTDDLAIYKDKLLLIGRESEWLIRYGLDVDWTANGHEKYWKLLRDKNLASFQGRCNYAALEAEFNDFWGADFLAMLLERTADRWFKGWIHQVEKDKMQRYKPLYHILLMCFLTGSVSDFVKSNPADTPYGYPPFMCVNPICPHYRIGGADMVEIRYYGNGVTAVFECSHCGMRYRHNKAKCSRELRVVVDYGQLWMDEFRRCCHDKSITNEQMSAILKRDVTTIQALKKELGLSRPYHYDLKIGAKDYYKAKVTELSAEYAEVTIALLNDKVPGAYEYLKRHEAEWIRSRVVFVNEQKSILDYERELVQLVQAVISRLKTDGYPKRQVTYGYIAKLTGSTRDKLRERTAAKVLLECIIESKCDWLRRRATELCKERAGSNKTMTTKTIKRELYLRDATFRKYENMLQEIIDSIYE